MKVIYRIFGSSHAFIALLAWFLIITGAWMLLRSDRARSKMARQGFFMIKGYIFLLAFFGAMALFSFSSKMGGMRSVFLAIAGFVCLICGYTFLKRTVSQKISSWVMKLPVRYVRLYAGLQVAIGAGMLILQRRI